MVGYPLSIFLFLDSSHVRLPDSPEIGPGTLIGASSSFSPGPTGSKTANSPPTGVPANGTATPRPTDPASSLPGESPSGGSSHTAAIVGGVVGAIAFLAIVVLVIAYLRRQCNTRSPYAPYAASSITAAPSFPPVIDYASQTHSGARRGMSEAGTIASSAMPELRAPMGVYVRVFRVFVAFVLVHVTFSLYC